MTTVLLSEDIARVCHEANRAYCQAIGDRVLPPWDECDPQVRVGATAGVRAAISGPVSPATTHESWCRFKKSLGWQYGPVTDDQAKTHKNLVPYVDLPIEQKAKDHLFLAIVHVLMGLGDG